MTAVLRTSRNRSSISGVAACSESSRLLMPSISWSPSLMLSNVQPSPNCRGQMGKWGGEKARPSSSSLTNGP